MPVNLLASVYAKLAALTLVLAALAALWLWGHHVGASGVQAQWEAAKAVQVTAAANQRAASAQQTLDWTQQFQSIATHYEGTTHGTSPTVADATDVAMRAGTVRLRDEPSQCPAGTAVSAAAARSRAADAAATQALADRVQNSIAAVRIGDAADKREHDLGEQVIALQALLQAERQRSPTP